MQGARKKWAITILLAIIVLAGGFFVLRPAPIVVEIATVERRDIIMAVEEQGRTRPRNPFIVASHVGGRLLRSSLNEGEQVIKGQILARIALAPEDLRTEAVLRANLAAAEARLQMVIAELAEAQGAYEVARREEARRSSLAEQELVSDEEMLSFQQAVIAAAARVTSLTASQHAAEAEVAAVRSQLLGVGNDDGEMIQNVYAPSDGTIYQVFEESERIIPAGAPLFEISNDDVLEVEVDLLTQEAVLVETGDRVLLTGWGGDGALEARVRHIEPRAFTKVSALGVEEQRVNVIADLQEIAPRLGAGYRVEAAIITRQEENVLAVSVSAIFQRAGGWHVFAVSDGTAVLSPIDIGVRNRDFAEVVGGLEEGDSVILFPSDLIRDGVGVRDASTL